MNILAVIPARGGSKGLPKKNIKLLAGKPLIVWTIESAKKSKYITDVVVSTDDSNIAKIAKNAGAWIPNLRPLHLATDEATTIDVLKYTLIECESANKKTYDYIITLQPTSPLRTEKHINDAIELLINKKTDSLASFVKCKANPFLMITACNDCNYKRLISDIKYNRRQDLPQIFEYNGAIYISSRTLILNGFIESIDNNLLFEMDEFESIDIDNKQDFLTATKRLKYCQ